MVLWNSDLLWENMVLWKKLWNFDLRRKKKHGRLPKTKKLRFIKEKTMEIYQNN